VYINFLTPWNKALRKQLNGGILTKKFPVPHGTRRFLATCHSSSTIILNQKQINLIHNLPFQFFKSRFNIILEPTLSAIQNRLFPSWFPVKFLHIRLFCPDVLPDLYIFLKFFTFFFIVGKYKLCCLQLYIFSICLPLPPSQLQSLPSVPFCQTPSV